MTLALVGVGGFLVYKSGILQNLGSAVGGIGEGAATAVQGAGNAVADITGDASQITGNVADLTNPLGALGNAIANLINNQAQAQQVQQSIKDASTIREATQASNIDIEADRQAASTLSQLQAYDQIYAKTSGTERKVMLQDELTSLVKFGTSIDNWVAGAASSVWNFAKSTISSVATKAGSGQTPTEVFVAGQTTAQNQSKQQPTATSSTASKTAAQQAAINQFFNTSSTPIFSTAAKLPVSSTQKTINTQTALQKVTAAASIAAKSVISTIKKIF